MEYMELKESIKSKLLVPHEFGEKQNLLKLGLNSLKIMRLVNQWRKKGTKVSYGELMQNPTLDSWWSIIQSEEKKKTTKSDSVKVLKHGVETNKPFPLTDVQYAYKIGRSDAQELGGVGCHAYLEFSGENVEVLRLQKAWNTLQYHHTMLRARFLEDGSQEIMDKPYDENIIIKDLRECENVEETLKEIREQLSHRKLKVEEGQVAGITLSLLPEGKTRIHFDLDLLVADVQSLQILLRDLSLAYMGRELPKESKDWSFAGYLEAQSKEDKYEKEKAEKYWKDRLGSLPFGPEIPIAKEPSEIENVKFNRRIINIEKEEWDILQKRAGNNHATPAMFLLSAYAMVLERWAKEKHFLINIPLFNRKTEYEGLEDVVADFTTLLLLEVDMRKKQTFLELLDTIQKQVHEDMKYTAYSGVQVQRDVARVYGANQNIAPIVFACNLGNPLITTDFKKNLGEFSYMISQTPGVCLDFQVYEDENGLMLAWDTVDELFPEGMIDDMIHSFEECLHRLRKEHWNQYFDVLPAYQKDFVEKQKNVEVLENPQCLHESFMENADKNPEKTAIIDTGEGIELSYSELRKEALAVASFIAEKNISRQPIAISLTRGYRQAVTALGILLSGNLYVPVSLNQPKERRGLIHQRTGIHYVITDENNLNLIEWPDNTEVLKFEELIREENVDLDKLPEISPEDSAYIIMTSGTTGFPKGAEMYHRGAANTIADINERFNITADDSVLGVSSMDFDLSVYDLFGTLSSGATLVMIPEEKSRDAEFWMEQIMKYQITVWNSVPVLLDMLLVAAEAENIKLPLKRVMLSGDWIGMDLPQRAADNTENCRFIAMGGATEASIWSNYLEVKLPLPSKWTSIPYGRPLAHQSYRVVDEKGMDMPFLVEGELWIGGAGVGTYRGDDELVKKKFIKDSSGTWYRTGDKGRFWNDGTIEFLGREDFQVKIRGHRIELGEIESTLKSLKDVNKVVVESSDGTIGDKHLIAYLETNSEKNEPLYLKDNQIEEKINNKWNLISNIDIEPCQNKDFDDALKYGEVKSAEVMMDTLKSLGIFNDKEKYTFEEIIQVGNIAEAQKKTVYSWLKDLSEYKFIDNENGNYSLIENIEKTEIKAGFNEIDAYMDKLKGYLPQLLTGAVNPLEVYYAEEKELSPNNLLDRLPGSEDTANVLINEIEKLVYEADKQVKILENGTRDLKITKMILDTLKDKNVEYTYTDSSVFFVNEAKELAKEYPFMKFEILDLEKEETVLTAQEQYDCVIAVNSVHRMSKLDKAFDNIKKLLIPEGNLLMLELTIQTYLKDITAAILEGGNDIGRDEAILNLNQWKDVLRDNGFNKVCVYPEDAPLSGRNVFTAMCDEQMYILNNEYITSSIKEKLPEYMIPKVYHALEKLPLSKNGKIDRKALRAFGSKITEAACKEEASTESEKELLNIWKDVFKLDEIGVLDNYYLLGGDSLIATRMLTKVRDKFKIAFSIKDLMGLKTIKEQAARIDELLKGEERLEAQELPAIIPDKEHENEPFTLTEVQQAYWIGRSGMYDLGQVSTHCYFELDGHDIDIMKLQNAWNDMVKQHGMMRSIILANGQQQILKTVPEYEMPVTNLAELAADEMKVELDDIRSEMSHQVITTETWPLFDVRATVMNDKKVRIHVSFDNLIFDGWSMFHLLDEWARRYRDEISEIPQLEVSFRDYVLGLEQIKDSGAYKSDKEYWMGRIDDFAAAPELPLAKSEAEITEQKFSRRSAYLNKNEWESLKNSAKTYGITPAVLLITAYTEVLRRYSSNMDFTLNLTQFDRKPLHPQVNELVGDFTTLTLLEVKNSREADFINRAKVVQSQLMEDLEHTFYSAVEVERELKRKNGNSTGSIMPIVFTSGLGIDQWNEGKWIGELVYNVSQTPQVWLDHQVVERDGGLGLFWDSVDELFYPGMIDEMFNAYEELLKGLAARVDKFTEKSASLVHVEISEERKKANETAKEFNDKSLEQLFLEMEEKFPEKTAVVNKEYRLTYREVKEKSLYICRKLQEAGVEKEELTAVLMDKSWEQIISVYGILFAGAAYLPLDIENPQERLAKILNDSKTRNVLVKKEFLEENSWLREWNCIVVDGEGVEKDDSIIVKKDSNSLAYTIYTSGSTGMPKGVMISHKGAVNTILDINSRFKVNENDAVIALSNLHFDLSVYDVFGTLGSGAKLVIPDSTQAKEPSHWVDLMNKENITVWNSVPTFVEMLTEYETHQRKLTNKDLRLVMMSGDWIATSLPDRMRNIFDDLTIISMGGATEASIWSNIFEVPKKVPESWSSIPYGKPLANQKYYILNPLLKNCPDYVPGMLYIAGKGLAKGYLNDIEKTKERFIYHQEIGEILYCTGDMGRYHDDGNIEFLGRCDNQIKVNGYRVELGEIESALCKVKGIVKAVAMPVSFEDRGSLIAFVECSENINDNEVKEELRSLIPEYEIPKKIFTLQALPLSGNGKIDRKALNEIWKNEKQDEAEAVVPPRNDRERSLLKAYEKVLGINIGIQGGFFANGGDSLKGIRLVNILREELNYEISLRELYKYSKVEELAQFIDAQSENFEEGTL